MISCDYGTTNPCVFLDTYDDGDVIWVDNEYRWDSRSLEAKQTGQPQKTDSQYADDMAAFMGSDPERICSIIVDPSAASFITELKGRGYQVIGADNTVLDGIRIMNSMFARKKIMVHERCRGLIDELHSYVWDDKAVAHGEDKPVKENDHGVDGCRYRILQLPSWRVRTDL
jgi:phage terminase large subunit